MDERLALSAFASLIGPGSHHALHLWLQITPHYTFVREHFSPARERLIIIVRDSAGDEFRLLYHPADSHQSTWRLCDAARCVVEDVAAVMPAVVA